MHLTRFTDLSLRVMMYLTYTQRRTLVTVTELSNRFQWSRNHMVKVVHFLSLKGWITTQRGRSGGLSLAHPASEYRLGDLVRTLENQTDLIDCFEPSCPIASGCRLRVLLQDALDAFYDKLNETTLETLTQHPETHALITTLNEIPIEQRPTRTLRQGASSSALIRQMQERVSRHGADDDKPVSPLVRHGRGIRSRRR